MSAGPLQPGELVLLVDRKDRRYLFALKGGGEFHSHSGIVAHDDLIDGPAGIEVKSSGGATYLVIRPTLSDFVLKMPRGAQIIYPKDIGPIMMLADIFPGCARVRVRHRLGRPVHRAAPFRRRGVRLRAPGGLRVPRTEERRGVPRR